MADAVTKVTSTVSGGGEPPACLAQQHRVTARVGGSCRTLGVRCLFTVLHGPSVVHGYLMHGDYYDAWKLRRCMLPCHTRSCEVQDWLNASSDPAHSLQLSSSALAAKFGLPSTRGLKACFVPAAGCTASSSGTAHATSISTAVANVSNAIPCGM